jgi:hypothetical protein
VVAKLTPSPVPADASTPATLHLLVTDEAGEPLAGAHLVAVASHGDVGRLRDEGNGQYVASYLPPAGLPADGEALRVVGQDESFEESLPLPLRERPGRLLLGVRGSFTTTFDGFYGPKVGLDGWVPFRLGSQLLGLGLSALYGTASQTISDSSSSLTTQSTVDLVPITLRLGYELFASRRFSLWAGVGGVATYVRFTTAATGEVQNRWGYGAQGFLGFAYALGPGQLFGDLSYTYEPLVQASSFSNFSVDPGGLALEAGYRFAVL